MTTKNLGRISQEQKNVYAAKKHIYVKKKDNTHYTINIGLKNTKNHRSLNYV